MCEVIHLAGTDREILSALAEILSARRADNLQIHTRARAYVRVPLPQSP